MFKALNHERHHGEKCKQHFAQTPQFWVFLETPSETTWRYGRQGLRLATKEVRHHCFPHKMGFATDTGWPGRPNGVMLGCSYQRVHALGFTEPEGWSHPDWSCGAHGAVSRAEEANPQVAGPGVPPSWLWSTLSVHFPVFTARKREFSRHLSLVTTLKLSLFFTDSQRAKMIWPPTVTGHSLPF